MFPAAVSSCFEAMTLESDIFLRRRLNEGQRFDFEAITRSINDNRNDKNRFWVAHTRPTSANEL